MKEELTTNSNADIARVASRFFIYSFFVTLAVVGPFVMSQAGEKDPSKGLLAVEESYNIQTVEVLTDSVHFDRRYKRGVGGYAGTFCEQDGVFDNRCVSFLQGDEFEADSLNQISVYVVREGDSLSQIAEMYGVSTNTIRWMNDIESSGITPGQKLVILPISGIQHEVEDGDTLSKIAKKYSGEEEEIMEYNDLSSQELSAGQVVVVPNGREPQPDTSSAPAGPRPSGLAERSPSPDPAGYSNEGEGYYVRPIEPGVGVKTQAIHGYNAIDIGAAYGTPVRAAAGGEVIISRNGYNGGYGNYVVISHSNGTQTLYSHNSQNLVTEGQWVDQGQTIANLGSTGRSTGPHLHFEIRGGPVNPF